MKITYHHRTRGTGAEGAHIRGITNGLRELGHEVMLLSVPGADPEREKSGGQARKSRFVVFLTNLTWHLPELIFELLELCYNLIVFFRIGKCITNSNTELIYERYALFMFAGVWRARLKGIPCILEVNDSCLVQRVRPLMLARVARYIERWIFQNATGLVFISSEFLRVAREEYKDIAPSVVSPNAADPVLFDADHSMSLDLRKKLEIDDYTVVGFVGAFNQWHGIDWFIEEIADRLSEFPELILLLIGDGPCFEPTLEFVKRKGLSGQVLMPGRVPHSEVRTYIGSMDLGILPDSNNYGSPMKLFEFMAMARAMVVPDYAPINEVVVDNQTGWVFPAGNRRGCIDRVLALVDKHEEHRRVGDNAREYIVRERQWRHNAEQLLTLLPIADGER